MASRCAGNQERCSETLALVLDSASQIDRMPVRTILEFPCAACVAHLRDARIHADSQRQRSLDDVLPISCESRHFLKHGQRCAASQKRVIFLRDGGIPHCENAVPDIIDDQTVVLHDAVGKPLHHVLHQPAGLLCSQSLGKGRKAPQVTHENGDVLVSAFQ